MPHDPRPPRSPEKPTVPYQHAVTAMTEARVFRAPPPDATPEEKYRALEELAAFYATVSSMMTHGQQGFQREIHELRKELAADRTERKHLEERVRDVAENVRHVITDVQRLTSRVATLETAEAIRRADPTIPPPPLPAMRDTLDTQTFVVDAKAQLETAVARLADESPGPLVTAPPEKIVGLFEEQLDVWAAKREQARQLADYQAAEAAKKRREQETRDDRRAIIRNVIGAVIGFALIGALGYLAGHAKGIIERDTMHDIAH